MSQIEEALRALPLRSVLTGLGRLCTLLEVRGLADSFLVDDVVNAFLPPEWAASVGSLIGRGERVFTSPQVILLLARMALVTCPDIEGRAPVPAIGVLLLALADNLYTHIPVHDPAFELELARNGLFYDTTPPTLLWGRYERIWREIAPAVHGNRSVNVAAAVEEATGVPFDEYVALGAGLYLQYFGKASEIHTDAYWTPEYLGDFVVDPKTVAAFVSSWAEEPDWFRKKIELTTSAWDFTPLRLRPLLKFGTDVAPLSVQLLLEKGTDGIYFTLLDHFRTRGGSELFDWTNYFGRVWERYVTTLLDEYVSDPSRILTEEWFKSQDPSLMACDRVVLYPRERVLFEAVAKRITLPSAATGTWEDLERDLAGAVLKKARQLAATIDRLRADNDSASPGYSYGARFLPVVVLPGPFPNIPPIVRRIRSTVEADRGCRALLEPGVEPLIVLEAKDYELLLGTSSSNNVTIVELLDDWRASELSTTSFWNWLTSERQTVARTPDSLERASEALLDRTKQLFPQSDGPAP